MGAMPGNLDNLSSSVPLGLQIRWRTTSIYITISRYLLLEVKQVEVKCHLMHADFCSASFYTLTSGTRNAAQRLEGRKACL